MGRKAKSLTGEAGGRQLSEAAGRASGRDWFDWATLLTAAVGAIVVVVSTVLTQLDSAESGKRAAASLDLLTQQARASQAQASAATKMANITSQQLEGLKTQLGEMKSQSTALSASADAANEQLQLASRHNRLSVRPIVGFDREAAMGGEVGIYVYNSGTGPASIRDLEVYLDGQKLKAMSDLQWMLGGRPFRGKIPKAYDIFGQRTINPSQKLALFHTDSDNVASADDFFDLIVNRISIIAKSCSLYEECEYFCSRPSLGAARTRLPSKFRKCD